MNKLGKSDLRDHNVRFLAARIGNRTLVEKHGALCAGTFNSTEGIMVREGYKKNREFVL